MLSVEILKKIRRFHFKTGKLASDLFAGQYESAYKGRGMEFAEVREYQPGDDIRNIDWNVTARYGHPFIKVFHEERELTVLLLLDISGSNLFGTKGMFKRELLAEVAGMLAFLAIRTNDKVGSILFTSQVEKYIPPKKGASHVWRLIKEIFTYEPKDRRTSIDSVLQYLNRVAKRHAIVFLISDCMDSGFERSLRLTSKKHDLTLIRITDPAEEEIPDLGIATFNDPETGETVVVNTSSRDLRTRWQAYRHEHREYLNNIVRKAGVEIVDLFTGGPVVEPLTRLFEQRRGRM
ncbi:MAG: DUF58 domain-containing protein [Deltaproteobacteria bacterium]|nr:DUF58 domain-containing protein [Deltaproteobacteria bacterium]